MLAAASYDPWGTPQGALLGPFGFTGELHHGDQVYVRARWYAPGWGTFPTRDPFAGFPETPYSLHAYQYAYSNPVVFTDPTGSMGHCALSLTTGPAAPVTGGLCVVASYAVAAVAGVTLGAIITCTGGIVCEPHGGDPFPGPPVVPGPGPLPPDAQPPMPTPGPSPYVPTRDDYIVTSPLTGPEEACWVIPGPLLAPPPWPFTTGAPGEPVAGPVVVTAQSSYTSQDLYTHSSDIAHRRSTELQQAVPVNARGRITMSAGVVENPDGTRQVLIGSSEPGTYLRPGVPQALEPGETVVSGVGHAEEKIVKAAIAKGQKVIAVGAGRPHCPSCVNWITSAGGVTASPRR